MRQPKARVRLSESHREKKEALNLKLRPDVHALHDLATLLDDRLEKDTTLLLVNRTEASLPKYVLHPKEREIIQVVTDTIDDEHVLMGAVAHALHNRVEARRVAQHEENYRLAGGLALTGMLAGLMSQDRWIGGISWGVSGTSVLAARYLHTHPPVAHDLPELPPSAAPPIQVLG